MVRNGEEKSGKVKLGFLKARRGGKDKAKSKKQETKKKLKIIKLTMDQIATAGRCLMLDCLLGLSDLLLESGCRPPGDGRIRIDFVGPAFSCLVSPRPPHQPFAWRCGVGALLMRMLMRVLMLLLLLQNNAGTGKVEVR